MSRSYRSWRASEDRYLIRHAGAVSLSDMADALGRTENAVRNRIHRINQARGTALTTSVQAEPELCLRCGNLTYLGLDDDGWCDHCQIQDAIEWHDANITEDAQTLEMIQTARTPEEARSIRRRQRIRNQEKQRARRREEQRRKASGIRAVNRKKRESARVRSRAGTSPRGGEGTHDDQARLFEV